MRDSKTTVDLAGVYGMPPAELLSPPAGAIQFSPLIPGASMLELPESAKARPRVVTIHRRLLGCLDALTMSCKLRLRAVPAETVAGL